MQTSLKQMTGSGIKDLNHIWLLVASFIVCSSSSHFQEIWIFEHWTHWTGFRGWLLLGVIPQQQKGKRKSNKKRVPRAKSGLHRRILFVDSIYCADCWFGWFLLPIFCVYYVFLCAECVMPRLRQFGALCSLTVLRHLFLTSSMHTKITCYAILMHLDYHLSLVLSSSVA